MSLTAYMLVFVIEVHIGRQWTSWHPSAFDYADALAVHAVTAVPPENTDQEEAEGGKSKEGRFAVRTAMFTVSLNASNLFTMPWKG